MTRAESMDVINDSTTMQSRIDTVLADPTLEWDHSPEIGWQPGDFLWKHPEERVHEVIDFDSPVLERPHGPYWSRPERGGGNCPRYMLEIIGLDDYYTGNDEFGNAQYTTVLAPDDTIDGYMGLVDCEDCLVGIDDEEVHCWNCGKRVLMESKAEVARAERERNRKLLDTIIPIMHRRVLTDAEDRLVFDVSSAGIRGQQIDFQVLDESVGWMEFPLVSREDFITYPEWDVQVTMEMHRQIFWGDGQPIEPYEYPAPNVPIFWDAAQNRWAEIQLESFTTVPEPQVPDVPTVTLQDTRPDLYRPGYERYFESETSNAIPTSQRDRHNGRPGGPRHRQG